jgi:hypothetical protein
MQAGWLALAPVVLATACSQHPPGWDDAWAACQAEATEQMELADPDADQRAEWQENYIQECMDKKGFKQSSTM